MLDLAALLRAGKDTPELQTALSEAMRGLWAVHYGDGQMPAAAASQPSGVRSHCPHEGPIVEPCTSGCGRQWRDVHLCLYDGHDFERCVRGASGNPEIQSCSTCPHHPAAGNTAG